MSHNEVTIFAVLIGIGTISGILFGYLSAKRGKGLGHGIARALPASVLIPLGILLLFAYSDISSQSDGVEVPIGAALGITCLYGIGTSIISGLSALISCWVTFRSNGPA